jgi:hypothetical protein
MLISPGVARAGKFVCYERQAPTESYRHVGQLSFNVGWSGSACGSYRGLGDRATFESCLSGTVGVFGAGRVGVDRIEVAAA